MHSKRRTRGRTWGRGHAADGRNLCIEKFCVVTDRISIINTLVQIYLIFMFICLQNSPQEITFACFLPLDEAVVSTAVFVIESGSDG